MVEMSYLQTKQNHDKLKDYTKMRDINMPNKLTNLILLGLRCKNNDLKSYAYNLHVLSSKVTCNSILQIF